jgi:hypothetical protein
MSSPAIPWGEIRTKQLAMTRETWSRLQSHGVTELTELRLEFFYNGPSRGAAEALQAILTQETDYESRVVATREIWGLRGKTQAAQVNEEMLLQWVDWMISAGHQFELVFDGWGATIPR